MVDEQFDSEFETKCLMSLLPVVNPQIFIDYIFIHSNPHVLKDSPYAAEFAPASNYPRGVELVRRLV